MNSDQIVTVIVGVAQSGAAWLIIQAFIKSLRIKIDGLKDTVEVQSKTIEAMEKRVHETEKIGDLYKGLVRDLPTLLESLSKGKDQIIKDLEATIEHRERTVSQPPSPQQRKEDKSVLLTMRFMLSAEGGELSKLAQGITGNIDSAAVLLSRAKGFDDFIASAGGRIQLENNKEEFMVLTQFQDDQGNLTGVRTITQSMVGYYAIFSDRKLILNSSKYHDFKSLCDKLQMEIDTLS
jgi:hypothetical protein